jgi:diphosphomevalonate decarboxylase
MNDFIWSSQSKEKDIHFDSEAPSNIAWIKYWGKKSNQMPINPSLSMTLKNCVTKTKLKAIPGDFAVDVIFEHARHDLFSKKYFDYLKKMTLYLPFLSQFKFQIESSNSFPHSSGIASSASSFASLATILETWNASNLGESYSQNRASFLARLGSGSACRSLYPGYALWGKTSVVEKSSDEYACDINDLIHPVFKTMCDTVCIVSKKSKNVSSTQGHQQMNDHSYLSSRLKQAEKNLLFLLDAFKMGDVDKAGQILEEEALTLHALMMTSPASFILLEPLSLSIIQKVRTFRQETSLPVYFTIDAGPNIHLIYPAQYKEKIHHFIKSEIGTILSSKNDLIWDEILC